MTKSNGLKNGEYVYINNLRYMFLGYSDYERKYAKIADMYGNTTIVNVANTLTKKGL